MTGSTRFLSGLSAAASCALLAPAPPAYVARGGRRLDERTRITLILENILDKNYRTTGSGVDAPGVNAMVSLSRSF